MVPNTKGGTPMARFKTKGGMPVDLKTKGGMPMARFKTKGGTPMAR